MLPFDDARWQSYLGGYRVPYDASPGLRRLLADGPDEQLWEEFCTELHHQGEDPGEIRYHFSFSSLRKPVENR